MTDRFLALVEGNSMDKVLPRLIIDVENQKKVMKNLQLAPQKPVVAFCPGAEFGDSKQWPARHFATLGRRLVQDGYDIWLVGGPRDISVSAKIEADIGEGCTNLVGKTSILDAIDLISLADRVVTNDSGLMHVAAAVGTPLVAIYGSTSPAFTPPLTESADVIGLPLNCRPCFKRQCPLGHKNCLDHLMPEHVLARL